MAIKTRTVDYDDQGTALEAYLAWDNEKQGRRPTILIAHQWDGRSPFIEDRARAFAAEGYVAFALDIYGKGVLGTNPEQNQKLMAPFMENRKLLARRLHAGWVAASQQPMVYPEEMAAIGYCFGGLCVLDMARAGEQLAGVASFHGLLEQPQPGFDAEIQAKILVMSGADDPMVPMENVSAFKQEMTSAGADWQVHIYGGAKHAFAVPGANNQELGIEHDAKAQHRSWFTTLAFLEEIFNVD